MRQRTQDELYAPSRARATTGAALAAAALLCLLSPSFGVVAQPRRAQPTRAAKSAASERIPEEVLLRIVRAEDERRFDADDLGALIGDASAQVRARAAVAAGRVGDARAVPQLLSLLTTDKSTDVRARAAFALGEIESAHAIEALAVATRPNHGGGVRARAVEALGKIAAAALAVEDAPNAKRAGDAILSVLNYEHGRRSKPDDAVALLALTAALRARPAEAGKTVALYLDSADARLRGDAANTLARLRSKGANDKLRALLANDPDAVVRANAARALGAAEDKLSLDALMERVSADRDARVRVSAARALATLRDARAADALLKRAETLVAAYRAAKSAAPAARPGELNELLEVSTALSRVLAGTTDARALAVLRALREAEGFSTPEAEIAFARVAPAQYMRERPFSNLHLRAADNKLGWAAVAAVAGGLGELAQLSGAGAGNSFIAVQADAQLALRNVLSEPATPALAVPDILRAVAAFRPLDLSELMRAQLKAEDTIVRATAAELLGAADPEAETARALAAALPLAMRDAQNDAALAILEALARQKDKEATDAVRAALDSPDYLLRLRAAALLQSSQGAGAEAERIQTVAVRYREPDYRRALARVGRRVVASVETDKGPFVIELLADDSPLTVDNFVELARRNYFRDVSFHRVVPNFVVQGGDPRGDGNGGPGYQIRCEINEASFARGAVGMALSGKDTGGSQWFVTHSPQPHLDGGYTVFGRVVSGMEVIDRIARGDRIRSITVTETARRR